jgi:hypothetical protein
LDAANIIGQTSGADRPMLKPHFMSLFDDVTNLLFEFCLTISALRSAGSLLNDELQD